MRLEQKVGNQGYFQLFKKKGELLEPITPEFKNLITDGFLTWVDSQINLNAGASNTSTNPNARCVVGTSSTPPTPSDTALGSVLGYNASRSQTSVTATYDEVNDLIICTRVLVFTFNQGAIIGNVAEVGITYGSTGVSTSLKSRTLVKDVEENPTTITLTEDDQLVVNYTDISVMSRTVNFSFNYNSVEYNVIGKFCGGDNIDTVAAHAHNLALGSCRGNNARVCENPYTFPLWTSSAFGGSPQQFTAAELSPSNPALGVKSKIRLPLANGNFETGFTGLSYLNRGAVNSLQATSPQWQFQITPKLPKTNQFVFDLEFYHKNTRA